MDLKAFKAKYGHCNVKTKSGEDKHLGTWCSRVNKAIIEESEKQQGAHCRKIDKGEHQTPRIHWI